MKKILTALLIIPIFAFTGLNVQKVTSTLSNIKGNKTLSFHNANGKVSLSGKIKLTTLANADIVLFSSKKHKSKNGHGASAP